MKNILRTIGIFTVALFIWSCGEDFIEEAKVGSNEEDIDDITNETLDRYLQGAYWSLNAQSATGSNTSLLAYNDIASDMVEFKRFSRLNEATNNRFLTPVALRERNENTIRYIEHGYLGTYVAVNRTNEILGFYQSNPVPDDNPQWAERLQGEAYFLRAYAHYNAANVFAPPYSADPGALGIVYMDYLPDDPTTLKGQSTIGQNYEQMIADLKEAIRLMPEAYDENRDPLWTITTPKRDAARFLLARIYFRMGNEFWTSGLDGDGGAMEQLNILLNSGRYDVPVHGNMFNAIYNQTETKQPPISEVVFKLDFIQRNGWRSAIFRDAYSADGRFRGLAFNKRLLRQIGWDDEAFASQDQRYRDLFVRYEKDGSGPNGFDPPHTENGVTAYVDSYNVWTRKHLTRDRSYNVFRIAEAYLMRAVINEQTGNLLEATKDVNVTRTRAGLPALGTVTLLDIENEWIKELAFEHTRLMFLQALKRDVPVPGNQDNPMTVPYNDPSLIRTLPATEIGRNTALGEG